jgi:hypothetical protein
MSPNLPPIKIEEIESVMRRVGIDTREAESCMIWHHPKFDSPLTSHDEVLAVLTSEEQAFFRCVGYALYENKGDPVRLRALRETFWITIRMAHHLPTGSLTVKEGKYIVSK